MTEVHVVVPDGIDDPARPSGGNTYDRRVCEGLRAIGWDVHEHAIPGNWPRPDEEALAALGDGLARVPDDAPVLVDGLIASAAPRVLALHAARTRLIILVHMPLGHRPSGNDDQSIREREHAALAGAAAIATTSDWTKQRLLELYSIAPDRIHVARPGVDPAELSPGARGGNALLCVAALTAEKGHDVLLDALVKVVDLPWHCVCVGSVERDPPYVAALSRRVREDGLSDRLTFTGALTGSDLTHCYEAADLLVVASRAETYGMVVTEALARGIPVVATDVGGLAEALGRAPDGDLPGILVRPEDPAALGTALRAWLTDADLRRRLRQTARSRRESLAGWSATASILAGVLSGEAP